ncbi:MBL fold metallo-hydrolase [Methylobacterium sp. IF7SW-B2]|jgi:glyoxylase-like metal-dependent hydrolase (beta-lactamase superfamily II)|nr:MBL fold metallo-hydrolase [Methylobacterium ajmalii]MBK3408478.1 MBL fold metallo-hydrolase [Methylobacterium ajmalii]MBK3420715.1 MBL fold metallo-hydrolase [Methylobacterium ajmalii]
MNSHEPAPKSARRSMSLSRRGFCLCCLSAPALATGSGWLSPRVSFAQAQGIVETMRSEAARSPIKVHRLRDGVAILEGSGGNVAVLTGADGKVLIDAGIDLSRAQMLTALNDLGDAPITHLINTHWHFDHTDGNAWLNAEGAEILAHANTRKHLASAQRVEDWDHNFPPAAPSALPRQVFSSEQEIKLKGHTLMLKHYGAAHTDSDISVRIVEADILHTGDTFWNGIYPFIDYSTGGHIDGMIAATEANIAATTDQTIVIPGHGAPVATRAQLQDFRDMLVDVRTTVAALKRRGLSLEATIAAQPTTAHDAKWYRSVITPALFTRLVYEGV